jgi:Zn-finger domain-containing protein
MDFGIIAQLGVAALAIYFMSEQSKRSEKRFDEYFQAFRALEADIRNKFATQIMENTNAMLEHSKIMQSVVNLLHTFRKKFMEEE